MAFKVCSSCNEKNPVRVRKCKKCDSAFAFKVKRKKEKKEKISDWKELKQGDYIKVIGGPVFLDKQKNEIPMGYTGTFSVMSLDKNGIIAHGIDKSCGFCHIWMGKAGMNSCGLLKKPHKIYKINTGN
jgi:ribosomal protein L40E